MLEQKILKYPSNTERNCTQENIFDIPYEDDFQQLLKNTVSIRV